MEISLKIKKPNYPNFILLDTQSSGVIGESVKLHVTSLEPHQVEEYIKLWSDGFREHCKTTTKTTSVFPNTRQLNKPT